MSSSEPEWAWLPKNVLALILNKLTKLTDYVRFSAVCAPWRYMALEDNNDREHVLQKQRLHILKTSHNRLPMLMISNKDMHSLYSITEGTIYKLQLPLPYDKRFVGSSHGWLFTIGRNMAVTLLNPLTGQIIPMPVFKDPTDEYEYWLDDCDYFVVKGILSSDPCSNPDDYEFVVMYGGMQRLAFFRSGDMAFTFIDRKKDYVFSDFLYHKGQFYAVNNWSGIVHIDFASGTDRVVIEPSTVICAKATYLVESQEGDLLVVQRFWDNKDDDYTQAKTLEFKVFKLLHPTGQGQGQAKSTLVEIERLGDQSLFLGDNHSVSVSTLEFPLCQPNCIYYTDHNHLLFREYVPHGPDDDSGIFNLEDRSFGLHYVPSFSQKQMLPPIWMVEDLNHKSQLLEAELERTSRQLKEATKLAREEAQKNKAAKEVIKSLTMQLKEMAERVPQESSLCIKSNLLVGNTSNTLSPSSTWSHLTTGNPFLEPYFDDLILIPILSNGSMGQSEKLEGILERESVAYT